MAFYPCVNNRIADSIIDGSIVKINSLVTTLRSNAFANCVRLTDINLPNVTTLPATVFGYCTALTKVDFPNITTLISANQFIGCTSLREAIFYDINSIQAGTFNGCTSLNTLVLKKSSMVPIPSTQPFTNTQFWNTGNGGKLYVPQALIATYQANQNWSDLLAFNANNQILAIEGSPYEN